MYLQLAERDPFSYLAESGKELYIFVPQGFRGSQKDMYVREDTFDNLSPIDYQQLMFELEPYQNRGMSGKADRQARKDARALKKTTQGGGARREARSQRQAQRQEARATRQASGGGFLDKIIGGATSIFGKEPTGAGLDVAFEGPTGNEYAASIGGGQESFMEKYKVPLIIGGVVLVAGGIYLATKKKK